MDLLPIRKRGKVTVNVRNAAGELTTFLVDRKAKGRRVWELYTVQTGFNCRDFFGLQYIRHAHRGQKSLDSHYQWLLMDEKVESQAGKPATSVLPADTWHEETEQVTWEFLFCVRYYVTPSVALTWDHDARHLFFLQLKDDVAQGRLPVSIELGLKLGGNAAQVMFGDYDDRRHRDKQYIRRNIMFPQQDEEAVRVIVNKHKNHCGRRTVEEARERYFRLCSRLPMFGIDLYPCKSPKGQLQELGISPAGIWLGRQTERQLIGWEKIASIECHKKKFIVEMLDGARKKHVNVCSSLCCRGIWAAAASQHTFFLKKKQLLEAQSARPRRGSKASVGEPTLTMQEVLEAVRDFTEANGGVAYSNTPSMSPTLPRNLSRSISGSSVGSLSGAELSMWSAGMIGPVSDVARKTRACNATDLALKTPSKPAAGANSSQISPRTLGDAFAAIFSLQPLESRPQ